MQHSFVHLHVHSQYSILDGASGIADLIGAAKQSGVNTIALTDHGNMFGAKDFFDQARKNDVKPIIGVEAYMARRARDKKEDKQDRSGYHLVLLAKNQTGYHNLVRMTSIANIEGYYYKPRIDRDLLLKYKEGVIVSSACLGGEIPQLIMQGKLEEAEQAARWFKEHFGADFYLELMRHQSGVPKIDENVFHKQQKVNEAIVEIAQKLDIPLIATNDSHFTRAEDAEAHDLLICLNTGKDLNDEARMRYTGQEYLKTPDEMYKLFGDIPEALENTVKLAEKVEQFELDHEPIIPEFPIPQGFEDANAYLRHITYEGAQERYPDITGEIRERLDFELETIKNMGFPSYFLIVWDFIRAAKEDMKIIVGPGRGSAAGSAVAYCTKITNVDPIKYNLLFERFLNPDRISMPDIDIDFDDDGRERVLNWVTEKYGHDKVAHIITFGSMAAKLAIRDVARILKLPLPEANRLAKMVPEKPKITLQKAFKEEPQLEDEKQSQDPLIQKTLKFAETLEGSIRQTGVHACGVLIGREALMEYLPVMPTKDSYLMVTQYDGDYVESIGMLKMDFLGLRTLSIIKDTLENIALSRNETIDIDAIPRKDEKTFALFSHGETTAVFQFESPGMKKHLRGLQPNRFEDLVAMNALYRPGPMEYIPSYIARKHGREKISYDHPMMEEILQETYGITVFQEQVMLLSRKLANFSRGQSDTLRKAMGKKKFKLMEELKVKFEEGCLNNPEFVEGCKTVNKQPKELIHKIWKDWEAFASYAFNKSHSVCYAHVAYQTGYLKANYPAEFMAAVMSRNLSDIKKITIFMDESRRMGLDVLGPDVNESYRRFTVNQKGAVRFGMAAIKGVGENAVEAIIAERDKNGHFKDLYDFFERIDMQAVNRKTIESLALAGGFDNTSPFPREQLLAGTDKGGNFIETLVRFGQHTQQEKNNSQQSLFGGGNSTEEFAKPQPPHAEPWGTLERLNKEKELIGIYLSAHPLDDFRLEMQTFCSHSTKDMAELQALKGREVRIGGMVTDFENRTSKSGRPYGSITIEDYQGTHRIMLFGKTYDQFRHFMQPNVAILATGRIEARRDREGEFDFRLNNLQYLAEARGKIKKLAIKVAVDKLTEPLITELKQHIASFKGESELNFLVYDPQDTKVWVNLFSRNHHVEVTNDLVGYLDGQPDVDYKIFS